MYAIKIFSLSLSLSPSLSLSFSLSKMYVRKLRSVTFDYVAIDHSHSQQPVRRGFPLFKRCKGAVPCSPYRVSRIEMT